MGDERGGKDYVSLTDEYKALMTLQYLKTTRGVETNVYNGMYFSGKLGDPNLGEMSYTKFLQQLGKIDADLLNITRLPTKHNRRLSPWRGKTGG